MAKITKATITTLKTVAKSGYVTRAVGEPLLNAGLILVDTNVINPANADEAKATLTDAGNAAIGSGAAPAATASAFAIITNAIPPESKRGNHFGRGASTKYPFADMPVGGSFFVPVSAELPDPLKTLGSTVSNANAKYAEKTGEVKQVVRTKRGEKNRAVLDADGKKVKETVSVEVTKPTRKFIIRSVVKDTEYGGWNAPADGVLIARTI